MVTHKAWKKNLLIKYLRPRDFRRGEMEGNMFKKMRRFKQQLSQEKCIEILTNEPHGVLSLAPLLQMGGNYSLIYYV